MNMIVDELDNIIKDRLKNTLINTDFRISIMFELMMQDQELDKNQKIINALKLYYPNYLDLKDVEKAVDDIVWFYKCGKELANSKTIYKQKRNKQIYSYEFDDDYIYSAFMYQYNIDLQDIEYLHWWKFKAMFNGLNEENQIVKIMGYRSIDLSKIKDKEERKRYKKLKELYSLPDMRTQEQKESDFASAFL